ncbi:MAG: DUF349 domain-containing protein [Bacteroidota bacterium]|nr:MAG: DUF349 domain-containing protein [Bacteroidota bacterium]
MTENDLKNSVQDEQTEKSGNTESAESAINDLKMNTSESTAIPAEPENMNTTEDPAPTESSEKEPKKQAVKKVKKEKVPIEEPPEKEPAAAMETQAENRESTSESSIADVSIVEEQKPSAENEVILKDEEDFTQKTKEQLLDLLKGYLNNHPVEQIRKQVEAIKSNFYRLHNAEIEELRTKFVADGGTLEDIKTEESPIEITLKELLDDYRKKRMDLSKKAEDEKVGNLKTKYDIIEAIKELVNSQESLNKTFHEFRVLQDRWRETGPVPQANVKDLWEQYHYHVEAFYDYIKINKELRDLDFKKNLDAKLILCEKAEELLLEPSVVEAFKQLQFLHDQWREVGPVPAEKRNELWERFKEATSKINHKHQEYFVSLKDDQKKNLQEKTHLCEKAEEIANATPQDAKEWEEKSKALIELQKIWKTIGFAPKKYNADVYERFRKACDSFFTKKRDFFAGNREEQENNLQLKTELCMQAEAMTQSTDWKKTSDDLIRLQKRWKTIGSVPVKHSDKIWKRFRTACDTFFNRKNEYFSNIDSIYLENLKQKEELLKEIESFQPTKEVNQNLEKLKEFQRRWSEIGFVPIKEKDNIQEKYRAAINAKFDDLKLDDESKAILKFRSKIDSIANKPNSDKRLDMEREKCYTRLKQMESDIALWENNIGFFSQSKNAASMIADIENKIQQAKERMQGLRERLNMLDDLEV